jgi:hypothetical protein
LVGKPLFKNHSLGWFFISTPKIGNLVHKNGSVSTLSACNYRDMSIENILILEGLTQGQKAKFLRLAKGLRQIDVASKANVCPMDITRLEHGRFVMPTHRKRILAVLGLTEEERV